jgi:hypothetical protein
MEPNPYEAPKEQGYLTPEDVVWWSWLKDRLMLWAMGWGIFLGLWGLLMLGVAIAWLLGYID